GPPLSKGGEEGGPAAGEGEGESPSPAAAGHPLQRGTSPSGTSGASSGGGALGRAGVLARRGQEGDPPRPGPLPGGAGGGERAPEREGAPEGEGAPGEAGRGTDDNPQGPPSLGEARGTGLARQSSATARP